MPIRYSAFTSPLYAAFHSFSALRQSPRFSAFRAALTWDCPLANAGVARHTTMATETGANARMAAPSAAEGSPAGYSSKHSAGLGGKVKQSAFLALGQGAAFALD